MSVELDTELAEGEMAAIELVQHVLRMRALGLEMPVMDELGNVWLAKVERWTVGSNRPN